MIRTMGNNRLHTAGRVTPWVSLACCIIAAIAIGVIVMQEMHPPRVIEHQNVHSATQPAARSTASSAATTFGSASEAPDFASA